MVRFLHTSDWHLGLSYGRFGDRAKEFQEIRHQTLKKLLRKARTDPSVDFILLAGDLFDTVPVSRSTLELAWEILDEAAPLPTYILPGNHDPLGEDSPYRHPHWQNLSHVQILAEAKPLPILDGKVILYPCPIRQKQSQEDPTSWIPKASPLSSAIRIGIAHGNVVTDSDRPSNFPIPPDRAEQSALDYLALGEWHRVHLFSSSRTLRMAYAGTPELTKFGEGEQGDERGTALFVTIPAPGQPPEIETHKVGQLAWKELTWTLGEDTSPQRLIEGADLQSHYVLRLHLKGDLSQWWSWRKVVEDLVFWAEFREEEVPLNAQFLTEAIPHGRVLPQLAHLLAALSRGERVDHLPHSIEPQVVQKALELLSLTVWEHLS